MSFTSTLADISSELRSVLLQFFFTCGSELHRYRCLFPNLSKNFCNLRCLAVPADLNHIPGLEPLYLLLTLKELFVTFSLPIYPLRERKGTGSFLHIKINFENYFFASDFTPEII